MDKEEYLLRKKEKIVAKEKERRKRKIKKTIKTALIFLVLLGGILAGGWFLVSNISPQPESEIVSKTGIHWHVDLTIKILGENQEIPANIGIGITEQYIHTHEPNGVIHLEFPGLVRKNDIRLVRFFEIWGRQFNKDCIFDKCSGPEGQLKMFVNGQENFEFENYIMRDGDKIEIIFE